MSTLKTLLLFALTGAIGGAVVASLIAPAVYSWYATGSGVSQEIISRVQVIQDTTHALFRAQLIGGSLGTLVMLTGGVFYVRWQSKRAARLKAEAVTSPQPPVPTAPAT